MADATDGQAPQAVGVDGAAPHPGAPGPAPVADAGASNAALAASSGPSHGYDFSGVADGNARAFFDREVGPAMSMAGVQADSVNSAAAWLMEAAKHKLDTGDVVATHRYNVNWDFQIHDVSYANWFLNSMYAAGVPQREVDAMLRFHFNNEHKWAKESVAATRARNARNAKGFA